MQVMLKSLGYTILFSLTLTAIGYRYYLERKYAGAEAIPAVASSYSSDVCSMKNDKHMMLLFTP